MPEFSRTQSPVQQSSSSSKHVRTSGYTEVTADMSHNNDGSSSTLDSHQQLQGQFQVQSGGEDTSSSGHLPSNMSASALAAMALGMDVNNNTTSSEYSANGNFKDGASSTSPDASYATAQQGGCKSAAMSSPSPVDSGNTHHQQKGDASGGSSQNTTSIAGNSISDNIFGNTYDNLSNNSVGQQLGANTMWHNNTSNGNMQQPGNFQYGNSTTQMQMPQGQSLDLRSQMVQQQVPSASQLLQRSDMSDHRQASSMSIGAKVTADTPIGPIDDGVAAFTAQDEQMEMATISPTELADAETDLRGIISQFNGLNMAASAGSASGSQPGLAANAGQRATTLQLQQLSAVETQSHLEHIDPALLRLDREIAALPSEDKADYLTVMRRCPPSTSVGSISTNRVPGHEPWDCYRTAYLEREGYDAARAARKLCKYWRIKASVFGAEAFCPYASTGPTGTGDMTLAQCFTESELSHYMENSILHVLEERDGAGRAILFLDPNRRDLEKFSTNSAMKSLFYLFQDLASDPVVRRRGFVMIVNMKIPSKKYDRSAMRALLPFIYDNLPLRCRGLHLINPSAISYYVIFPVIKYFLGREMRLRTKTHYGGPADTARSLAEYRLFSNVLPVEVGGTVEVNREVWLANRLMAEGNLIRQCQQRYNLQQQQQQQLQQQQVAQNIGQDLSGMGYNLADFEPEPIGTASQGNSFSNIMAEHQAGALAHSGQKRGSENEYVYSDEVAKKVFTESGHELKKRRSENEMDLCDDVEEEIGAAEGYFGESPAFSNGPNFVTSSQPQMLPHYGPIQQAISCAPSTASGNVNSSKKSKKQSKLKSKTKSKKSGDGKGAPKGGRQSDPRMIAAIEAKTRDANISLREALEIGGFHFPPAQGRCAAATVLDSDGVSLAQRKNQLSRRLRQLKEQGEKGIGSGKKGNANENEESGTGKVSNSGGVQDEGNNASNSSLKRSGSMDSFSDMVSNLPSINAFGV